MIIYFPQYTQYSWQQVYSPQRKKAETVFGKFDLVWNQLVAK